MECLSRHVLIFIPQFSKKKKFYTLPGSDALFHRHFQLLMSISIQNLKKCVSVGVLIWDGLWRLTNHTFLRRMLISASVALTIPNFSLFRRDRPDGRRGGELLVYISNDSCTSTTKRRHDLESADVECITLELHSDPKHILFFTYRPPDQSPTMFFDCMRNLLATAEKEAAILTLLGDMNAKHPSWQTSGPHNMAGAKLLNLLLDFGMTQCVQVKDPTRFSPDGDSHSVIDVYATNHPDLVTAINVSDPISDHCMVTTHVREPRTQSKHKRNESRSSDGSFLSKIVPDFRNVDWHGLRVHLLTSPLLEAIQGTDDVNCAAAVWESMFVEILQRHIPNRYIRHRPKNKVWMTSKLHRLSKRNFDSSKKLEQVDHLKIGPHTVYTGIFALPSFVQRNQLIFTVNMKRQTEAIGGGRLRSSWQRSQPHTWPYQTFVQAKMSQQLTLKKLPYWPNTLPANAPLQLHQNIWKVHRFLFLRSNRSSIFYPSWS